MYSIQFKKTLDLVPLLLNVLNNYNTQNKLAFKQNTLAKKIRNEFTDIMKKAKSKKDPLLFKGSPGQGQWAKVPWFGIFDSVLSRGPQEGIYLVFLFSIDMKRLYLSINQGWTFYQKTSTNIKAAFKNARIVTRYFQKVVAPYVKKNKMIKNINLTGNTKNLNTTLPAGYEVCNIYAYDLNFLTRQTGNNLATGQAGNQSTYSKQAIMNNNTITSQLNDALKVENILKKSVKKLKHNNKSQLTKEERVVKKILKNYLNTVDL